MPPPYTFVESNQQAATVGNPMPDAPVTLPFDTIQLSHSIDLINSLGDIPPDSTPIEVEHIIGLFDGGGAELLRWSLDYDAAVNSGGSVVVLTVNSQVFSPPVTAVPVADIGVEFSTYTDPALPLDMGVASDAVEQAGLSGYSVREISFNLTAPFWDTQVRTMGFASSTGAAVSADDLPALVYDPHSGGLFYFYISGGAARVTRSFGPAATIIAIQNGVNDFQIHSSGVTSIYAFAAGHILCCVYGTAAGIFARISTNDGQTWSSPVTIASNVSPIGLKFDPHSGALIVICKDTGGTPKRALSHLQGNGTLTAAQIANTTGLPSGLSGGAMDGEAGHYALVAKSGTNLNAYVSQGSDGLNWT